MKNILILISFLILLWIVGIISPLIIPFQTLDDYYILKLFYSPTCHQNPERCIEYKGLTFMVCSRCFGIYLGAFIMNIILIIKKNYQRAHLKYLYLGLLLIVLDILFYRIGLYSYNKLIALITGLFFGGIVFILIFESITKSILKDKNE